MSALHTATTQSPLGPLTAAATDAGLCLLEFGIPARIDRELAELEALLRGDRHGDLRGDEHADARRWLAHTAEQLDAYFAGERREFTTPLRSPGTTWQQRVWDGLRSIPFGATTTYGALAQRLGAPSAARAVGRANGSNRIAIIIPCHRVIETGGGLRGYAGGLERKRWLLEHEAGVVGASSLLGGSLFDRSPAPDQPHQTAHCLTRGTATHPAAPALV